MKVQREKVIQQHVVTLLRSIGSAVFVIGTRRRRGDHPGTMMTPGLPDLLAFLPAPPLASLPQIGAPHGAVLMMIECKAPGGRPSPDQRAFEEHCRQTATSYVRGGLDDVIAYLIAGGWLKRESIAAHHFAQQEA